MYNVTVKMKNSLPIVIEMEFISNILYKEHFLVLYRGCNCYRFAISEIEYYFIERIETDE